MDKNDDEAAEEQEEAELAELIKQAGENARLRNKEILSHHFEKLKAAAEAGSRKDKKDER